MECLEKRDVDSNGRRFADDHPSPCPGLVEIRKVFEEEKIAEKIRKLDPDRINKFLVIGALGTIIFSVLISVFVIVSVMGRSDVADNRRDQADMRVEWIKFKEQEQAKSVVREEQLDAQAKQREASFNTQLLAIRASFDAQLRAINVSVTAMDKSVSAFIEGMRVSMAYGADERKELKSKVDKIISSDKFDYRTK